MTRRLRLLMAELPVLRDLPDFGERPLPRVEADLGPAVPGWLLRAAAVLAAGTLVAVATQRTTMAEGLAWTLIGATAIVMAIIPSPAVAHAAVVAGGLFVAVGGHGPFDPVVFALIPLAYATVRLAWWAERVAPTARVEVAALARGLPGALALTGATMGFGALAFLLAGRPNPVLVVAGGVALIGLAWLVPAGRKTS